MTWIDGNFMLTNTQSIFTNTQTQQYYYNCEIWMYKLMYYVIGWWTWGIAQRLFKHKSNVLGILLQTKDRIMHIDVHIIAYKAILHLMGESILFI